MKKLPQWTLVLLALITSSLAFAAADSEEISYDDLINRISQKRSAIAHESSNSFDSLFIHAGFGLLTSVTNVKMNGTDSYRYQNGFLLSLGIDLFSQNLYAEGSLQNYGQTTSGTETRSLREFDLRLCYRDEIANRTAFHLGSGLATRIFKLSDPSSNRRFEQTTPSLVLIGGVDSYLNKNVSVGFEAAWQTALTTNTFDKNSIDLGVRLDTHF